MASKTVEDYLKTLFLEQQKLGQGRTLAVGRLASAMGVVPGTATSMVRALADSGLVDYESRAGVRLSKKGEQLALHVLRRHRLVELFLVKVLGLDWTEVHEEADALEHAISDRVLDRMDRLLEHPTVDPHGDPIPTAKGQMDDTKRTSLADCPLGKRQRVVRVLNQEGEFLRFVERQGLQPGAVVRVKHREIVAGAVSIIVGKENMASLGMDVACQILVELMDG